MPPVDLLRWLLAVAPFITLLVALLVLKWSAPEAGSLGLIVAALVGVIVFRAPLETVSVASAKGVWDAVFILYVVWPALLLYHIMQQANAFEALRIGIMQFSQNELFLVLAFGWVFVSFLQGIIGFGTPVAMVVPLLVALGVRPIYAVAIPLVGHAWGNMFGTLGVAWLATQQVIVIDDPVLTATRTAALLWLPNVMAGFFIAWAYGGMKAVRYALPMILLISLLHGGGQLLLMGWNQVLANFLSVTAGFIMLYPLSRWKRYAEPAPQITTTIMQAERTTQAQTQASMSLFTALLPYAVLTVLAVVLLVPDPINDALAQVSVGFAFPETTTAYEVLRPATDPYSPIRLLTHPGTLLLLTAVITFAIYRRFYTGRTTIFASLTRDAVPSSLAIVAFLVTSKLMDHTGQTEVFALGLAEVTSPTVYAFLSGVLGVLGAFITSSNTASNVLFAPVQQTVAVIEGLPQSAIIAAQGAGAAVGNAIAPANVVLGTGPAGILGDEGEVIRKTLNWTLLLTVLVGLGTVILVISS
ncbi:MAG: L-lactate permease [Anaerolineae bacterium]